MVERARIRRHPEREIPGEEAAVLAAGLVAHVGIATPEGPVVIPMTYHFEDGDPPVVWLHGSHASRLLERAAEGDRVCVAVTIVDGLVYSRSAMYHSANYRSVVCVGRARAVEDPGAKRRPLEAMIGRMFPGRAPGRDYLTRDADLDATALVAVEVEEWSAKGRSGGPRGPDDEDPAAPGTAGVIPVP